MPFGFSLNIKSTISACLGLMLTLVADVSMAVADELAVTLASKSEATVVLPKNGQKPNQFVVMIHGWAGEKDEVGGLFKRVGDRLAHYRIGSIRMDIRGESERKNNQIRLTSTFSSRIEDAQAGVNWVKENYPEAKIGLLGFSYGGATALQLVSQTPESFQSVVLWSSITNPLEILAKPELSGTHRTAIETGESTYEDWTTLTLTRKHIIGMIGYNPLIGLGNYTGALLSIRGSKDHVPLHGPSILAAANGTVEEYRVIQGADHIFNVFDPEVNYAERLIKQTTNWLIETM
jgi:pimeloyl-ACP methyl ester carboxylesterase